MNTYQRSCRIVGLAAIFGLLAICTAQVRAQSAPRARTTSEIRIVELQGTVEVSPAGAKTWVITQTNQVLHPNDRLRTGPNSRVALRWTDESIVPFGSSTELEILPPQQAGGEAGLRLVRGILSFFHRDRPGRIRIITRGAVAGVEGTEFVVAVEDVGGVERTTLSVIDGKVRFENEHAALVLGTGDQAVAEVGKPPARTAGFVANNILQWSFYYPAVLDVGDLWLTTDEQSILGDSLSAYRSGDLLTALAKYPAGRQPGSEAERIYYAALLLSVGEVDDTEAALSALSSADASSPVNRLAASLRELISAVKRQQNPAPSTPQLSTELLARSYYEQSMGVRGRSLESALKFAREAVVKSPDFGFGWTRVAELEFAFGNTEAAMKALDRGLTLNPRNAQALALKGFLLAAQSKTADAIASFDRALAIDSALANAWLGRGLCRIRRGDAAGREDLLVAAALEPQRAELRSYLGKAYGNEGDYPRAIKELELAKNLDPNDPTAWLYSALLNQENNRINDAIRDLEKSEDLNDNRSLYRSQLLLDQDQAVRGANLAGIYRDAGMTEVSAREAARAVNYDYANYSAHLFLANSYTALRDPNRIDLRYETPAINEFLLANLLAPVRAGVLSPVISQQEYSSLFERNHLGVVSSTEYLSRGAWTQSGAQFGVYENLSYNIEGFYRWDPGQRGNSDTEERGLAFTGKLQLTPDDSLYLLVQHYEAERGDVGQYYDPDSANPGFRAKEKQAPILGLGYHHEWDPGIHTLFFVTRLRDKLWVTNPMSPTMVAFRPDMGSGPTLVSVQGLTMEQKFRGEIELYSGELQHIWQRPAHNTIVGGRVQYGWFETDNMQHNPSTFGFLFPDQPAPAASQDVESLFKRFSVYGYHQWEICDSLQLIGGLSYDRVTFPENFRSAPISTAEETVDQISPKAGLIWRPAADTTVRFAYTRSLGGASLDQSYQLEPSQVAGFVQSFRSIIPESVAGPSAGARFEAYGISLEQKFDTGTYLGLSGELLNSDVRRTVGAFDVLDTEEFAVPSGLREKLDYEEQSLLFTVNQLVSTEWSFGGRYRLSRAVLENDFVGVPDGLFFVNFQPRQRVEGILHQVKLFTVYNHPCGFFGIGEALWYGQDNRDDAAGLSDDHFWHLNAFAGYRFPRRRAEVMIGVLNITDENYRLNPLNLYNELPRERTLAVRLRLNF